MENELVHLVCSCISLFSIYHAPMHRMALRKKGVTVLHCLSWKSVHLSQFYLFIFFFYFRIQALLQTRARCFWTKTLTWPSFSAPKDIMRTRTALMSTWAHLVTNIYMAGECCSYVIKAGAKGVEAKTERKREK